MESDLIHIQHFDARYRVSKSRDDPSSIQCRLDHIARDIIPRFREDNITHTTLNDDVICFIERMEITMVFDLSKSDDRGIAAIWRRALHEGIRRTIGQQGNNVIVFRDRSELLAGFLSDLLHGRAWEKWYYKEFEDLKLLSVGQAIVRILLADGDIGRDTLIELTQRGDLDLILNILTDADVEAVVSKCLLPPGPRVVLPNAVAAWVNAIRGLIATNKIMLISVISRDVARLYLHLLREHPELGPDVNLARFIYDLLQLRQTIVKLSNRKVFLQLIESGDLVKVLSQLKQKDGQQLLSMLIREIGGTKTVALLRDLKVEAPQAITSRISTQYGGIFLLAPAALEMGLYNFLQHSPCPEPKGISKAGLLFYIIALQCLGRKNVEQTQQDKGIALFASLSSPMTLSQISQYSETLTLEMHKAFTETFQAHQIKVKNRTGILKPSEPENISEWFSLYSEANSFLINTGWDTALSIVSSTVLMWFASKLGAFADSSPEYLCCNFLKCHAEIEISADRIAVYFLTCPLQMVLRMAGFDHTTWEVPWLENRKLEFHFHS